MLRVPSSYCNPRFPSCWALPRLLLQPRGCLVLTSNGPWKLESNKQFIQKVSFSFCFHFEKIPKVSNWDKVPSCQPTLQNYTHQKTKFLEKASSWASIYLAKSSGSKQTTRALGKSTENNDNMIWNYHRLERSMPSPSVVHQPRPKNWQTRKHICWELVYPIKFKDGNLWDSSSMFVTCNGYHCLQSTDSG